MPQGFFATGDIYPCRFVKMSGANGRITQCGAGDLPYGVSGHGTRRASFIDSSGKHAALDEPVVVYTETEDVNIELGGTVNQGDRLAADADGKGVATTTDAVQYGGFALRDGVAGEQIPLTVHIGEVSN